MLAVRTANAPWTGNTEGPVSRGNAFILAVEGRTGRRHRKIERKRQLPNCGFGKCWDWTVEL